MIEIIKKFIGRMKGKKEYSKTLLSFASQGFLMEDNKKILDEITRQFDLKSIDTLEARKIGGSTAFNKISNDKVITEEEKNSFQLMVNYLDLSLKDSWFDQKKFNKHYMMGLIEKGILPNVPISGLNISMDNNEQTHWACSALLRKRKNITKSYGYSGPTASIRIMKGFSYRMGQIKVQRQTVEVMTIEDTGTLWLSNKRIGFHGAKKSFAIEYKKIHSLEATGDGLVLFKQGRERPFIITPEDYDVPLAILAQLVNKVENE